MNIFNILNSFKIADERGWDITFWAIDIHDTISPGGPTLKFYPDAKDVLQYLTNKKDIQLILWTCSHDSDIQKALNWFEDHNIHFNHINSNDECGNTLNANFDKKPYYNVMLDDKSGFEGPTDWNLVKQELAKRFGDDIWNT